MIIQPNNSNYGINFEEISKNFEESFEQFKVSAEEKSTEFIKNCDELIQNVEDFTLDFFANAKATFGNLERMYLLKSLQENYCLNDMIKKIVWASQNNQKICLFIGRTADEPLPDEENCTWVSGDAKFALQPFSLEERIHLQCDFTDELQLEKIHNLFDKIVIDQSTCKFMNGDFISRFVKLLKKSEDSQLIFERTPYAASCSEKVTGCVNHYTNVEFPFSYLEIDRKRNKEIFTEYQEHTNQTKDTDQEGFRNQHGHSVWYPTFESYIVSKIRKEKNEPELQNQVYTTAKEDTDRHTATLFQKVEVYTKSSFPYHTNYSHPGKDEFVVATGVLHC